MIPFLIALGDRLPLHPALGEPNSKKHIQLRLKRDGKVQGWESVMDYPIRLPYPVPRTGTKSAPRVLGDEAKYMIGKQRDKMLAETRRLATLAPDHPGLRALVKFLEDPPDGLTCGEKDIVVPYWEDDGRPMAEDPQLATALESYLRDTWATTDEAVPLLDGTTGPAVLGTHFKVKFPGMENAQAMVTFDKASTWIFPGGEGKKMLHAPLSYDQMFKATGAANWLNEHRRLWVGRSKPTLTALAWAATPHPFEEQLLKLFNRPKSKDEWKTYYTDVVAPFLADEAVRNDSTPLYLMYVEGAKRFVAKDFKSLTVGEVAQNLQMHIGAFVFDSRNGKFVRDWSPSSLNCLLGGKKESHPVGLMAHYYDTILCGEHVPDLLYTTALENHVAALLDTTEDTKPKLDYAALAVVRAYERKKNMPATPYPSSADYLFLRAGQDPETKGPAGLNTIDEALAKYRSIDHADNAAFQRGKLYAYLVQRNQSAKSDENQRNRTRDKLSQAAVSPEELLEIYLESDAIYGAKLAAENRQDGKRKMYNAEVTHLFNLINELEGFYEGEASLRETADFIAGFNLQEHILNLQWRRAEMVKGSAEDDEGEDDPINPV